MEIKGNVEPTNALSCTPGVQILMREMIFFGSQDQNCVQKTFLFYSILQVSIRLHEDKSKEEEVVYDTTVQEKNITFPTDVKLYRKVIDRCRKIARQEGIAQRQSYVRVEKRLVLAQRFSHHPRNRKKARKAVRSLRTIAGRMVRELERKSFRRRYWSDTGVS